MMRINSIETTPLKIFKNKGTYKKRLESAKQLNLLFFDLLKKTIKKDSVSIIDYKNALSSVLPPNIKIHVKNLSKNKRMEGVQACVYQIYHDNKLDGALICLPYQNDYGNNNKTARVSSLINNLIAHENFHVFASLLNPKHVMRNKYVSDKDFCVYEKCLYGTKSNISVNNIKNFMKYLNKKDTIDKINFLQFCRYRLIEEDLAYKEQDKYGFKNYTIPNFYFKEKIFVLEKLLNFYIAKARTEKQKLLLKDK